MQKMYPYPVISRNYVKPASLDAPVPAFCAFPHIERTQAKSREL